MYRLIRTLPTTAALLILCTAVTEAREPLYPGLGSYARKITTDSPLAQRYFNQGLALLHGFQSCRRYPFFSGSGKDRSKLCNGILGRRACGWSTHQLPARPAADG